MVVAAAQFGLAPVRLLQERPRAWDVQRTASILSASTRHNSTGSGWRMMSFITVVQVLRFLSVLLARGFEL